MGMPTLFFYTLGVAFIGVALCKSDQSEDSILGEQPIETRENDDGKTRIETPEVVLQLKYNRGELNRIYLAQFRKGMKTWTPSVTARNNLCADLCHAGLGGEACGAACYDLMPVGLQTALKSANSTEVVYGQPRYDVCPTLCSNRLGDPLCNCGGVEPVETFVEWTTICAAFCLSDNYVLRGCPSCDQTATQAPIAFTSMTRTVNTSEGWSAWCNVQCRQGQGGAACNCDRTPF